MEFVEKAKVVLEIEDEESKVTLESLKAEAKEINKELRNMKEAGEVGSEAWNELKLRQREVNAGLREFTSNIDLNDASMNELTARSRQLQSEINKLKVGSEEWLAKLEELNTVNTKIADTKDAIKNFGQVIEDNTKGIDLNNASMDELTAHSRQINTELNKLTVGSKEWLEKLDELREVDARIDDVKKAMKGLGDEIESNAKVIDLNNASMDELTAHSRQINTELNKLTVGSKEWLEKLDELREVDARIDDVKKAMKGLGDEIESNAKVIDLNNASMDELTAHSRQINTELNKLTVGSKEWLEKLDELREVDARIDDVKKAMKGLGDEIESNAKVIDLNNASMDELTAHSRQINTELNKLTVGSKEWLEKLDELREVDARIDDVKKAMKGLGDEIESNAKVIDLNNASMDELTAHSRQINTELNKLTVGSKEWLEKLDELREVDARIDDVKNTMRGLGGTIDLNTASMEQLQAHSKLLHGQLNQLTIGSDEWLDKLSEIQKVDGMIDNAKAAMKGFGNEIDLNTASLSELQAHSKKLEGELHQLTVGSKEWLDKLEELKTVNGRIENVEKAMKDLGYQVDKQESLWDKMKTSAIGVFTGSGLLDMAQGAASQVMELGKEIFETTAKFEKYEAVLKNSLGSQEAASAAMGDIKKFAAETPFSVDELTESYVKYINRGIQPSMQEMQKLGDIAASQGKSFDQLTEAVLDAATGEFERLKEFGIQASKSGDQVEFSFKGIQKTVANTPEAIQEAILSFGELEGVAGGMAAISQTLEGRVSNLGDNFDSLKLTIGEGLKPVFGFLIDVMNSGIDVVKGLFTESEPIVVIFQNIGELVDNLIESYAGFFKSMLPVSEESVTLRQVINALAIAIQAASTPFRVLIAVMQAGYDSMTAIINKGKEVANFFGADFQIDTSATFDNMQKNFDNNMKSIQNSWTKTISEVNINTMKDSLDKAIDTENKKLEEAKKRIRNEHISEAQKLVEIQKINKEHDDKITAIKGEALNKQATVRIQTIEKTAKNEEDRAKKTQEVVDKLYTELNSSVEKKHTASQQKQTETEKKELEKKQKEKEKQLAQQKKADDKLRADTEKAEKDLDKKLETMRIKAIADEKKRKVEEINFKYKQDAEAIKTSLANETKKNEALENLEKERIAEVSKAEADFLKKKEDEDKKFRDKTAAEEKKLRDERLKESKALFDAEFSAEVAKAQNTLDLTKRNSAEMWDAKRNLLETEWRYKQQQLANEAAAEKARIAESIADTDQRRVAMENIDSKLKAKLSSEEQTFQQNKTKLNEEQNKQREENNKLFFEGLNSAMKGDFTSFMKFLADKVKNDKDANLKKLQDFSEKTQQISDAALQGINTLKQLNQQFLESQLAKIKTEKDTQIASWQKQYDSGKISKEEFEKQRDAINKDASNKELKVRKDAFEREKKMNIAAAAINTAQAALKSFAMFGWPIGAIMAALAAVAGGIQIAAIARQKFEGRKGGVVDSEGKIFAASGASIPRNAFVSQGDRHGSKYGEAGIAMINRRTGQEVGEIEGGEPVMVLSRNTYKNNGPIVDKLLKSSMYQNGAPITMANGGILTASGKRMFEDGGTIDTNSDTSSSGASMTPANTEAMMEESKKSAKDMAEIKQNTADMRDLLKNANNQNSKFSSVGNNQIAQIARTFYDVLISHGKTFDTIKANVIDSRKLLEKHAEKLDTLDKSQKEGVVLVVQALKKQLEFDQKAAISNNNFWNVALDEIMEQQKDIFDESIKHKKQLYDAKAKSENEWRNEERNNRITAMMLQRYMLSELQLHSRKLDEIRDKSTGTGDILHALGRIEANTAKSNLK
ncbi:tape measure protein [Flectobacillus major]|uniref:tape measure protein n=1 Tax=Flectobacillus major TaxID=103 RepID=UPI0003FFDFC4|nr:tape measure protein [Flectobacillus major]